jgi:hypothetical protein
MTTGIATGVEDMIMNALRAGGTTFTVVAGTYQKMHVGDPGAAGANNPAVGDATRRAFTQSASSGGTGIAMNGSAPVWTNTGTTETLTHASVWSASSAGTFLYSYALTTPQAWVNGNTFTASAISGSLSPNAA